MDVSKRPKLFRAIVVMGAAITAPGCDFGEDCCSPKKDAAVATVDAQQDAGVDASTSMSDAPVDVVLIL